ncbi:cyclic peptide export ABC transporter [Hahella sp. HN01]|uniref:cyclic peptide export ABC transporter n=1 Tax=Hahella sp. HN01 TaxID=2847262 RepID=UPI001C1EE568|nr:cyclic peptide export ABC transporter [Hahella sp. HN01]MBU6954460.1 cyclic peptide export ABC transporter [Hahella sp. HN01]
MEFLNFIKREHADFNYYALAMVVVSGMLNGVIAVIVIHAAQHAAPHELNFRYLLMFAVALAAFWLSKRYTLNYNTTQVEHVLERIRTRIADKIRKTDLRAFEKVGRGRMYSVLNTETLTLSQYTPFIINAIGSFVMVIFALMFIAYVSTTALLLTVLTTALCLLYFFARQRVLHRKLHMASEKQNEYFDALGELLDGFKELKINPSKSNCFYQERLLPLSNSMETLKIETGLAYNNLNVFTQSFTFILMASIIFLIPMISASSTESIPKLAAIMLFVIGPLSEIVGVAPLIAKSNVAIVNIQRLETELDGLRSMESDQLTHFSDEDALAQNQEAPFQEIRCDHLKFSYNENGQPGPGQAKGFTVGPIDLTIKRGEIIFMIGGNGSGKSTFLKLLTALYQPDTGSILLDGSPLHANNMLQYRSLYSVIFSDFHLFKHLYGVDVKDRSKVKRLLELMKLSERCQIKDNEISDIKLSTGQKKRMALIVSLLEDKQIYVFDEWAADQDPDFRRYFYETILPEMKAQGKTIIAATHDDHYFDIADRVIKLDAGKIITNPSLHI